MSPSSDIWHSESIPWVIIVGPTSSGKSRLAEALALRVGSEIVVADSRQVYQGMDIATNKPTPEEQKRVPRRLIDMIPPQETFSAGAYQRDAKGAIAKMETGRRPVIIEGGCGLYIRALLYGLWEGPPANLTLRSALQKMEVDEGYGTLHRLLSRDDPATAARVHPHDLPKIIRAIEVYRLTGDRLSDIHQRHKLGGHAGALPVPPPNVILIGLRRERANLYQRIEERIDEQVHLGLIHEVERLLSAGLSPALPSMQGLGYRQILPFLKGERTMAEAISLLKRDSRRYAKRQMTWFNQDPNIRWIDLGPGASTEKALDQVWPMLTVLRRFL